MPSIEKPPATPDYGRLPWHEVTSWATWLNGPDLKVLAASRYALTVIDYSRDGGPDGEFSASQIEALRQSGGCRRRVLAYLSIGQAEDYRWYWQSGWRMGSPAWLVQTDPDWPGNYYVRFWDPAWQELIFAYLDRILAAGFDGVYLDRVDAIDLPYAAAHRRDMIDFVEEIAAYARARSALGEDFGVFPQNAEELGADPGYIATVTGLGSEEIFYRATNLPVPETERHYRQDLVTPFKNAPHGGLLLTVDYATEQPLIDDSYARAAQQGYIEYVGDVALDRLRVNPGHEPSCH